VSADPWAELRGKHVLVGLTYVRSDGSVADQLQFHGRIVEASEETVTVERADNGEPFTLPPDPGSFEPAEPGEYLLHSTGEVVVDPELLSTWTIQAPDAE
jgi:hypothetical protein